MEMTNTTYETPTRSTWVGDKQILTVGELIGLLLECDLDDHVLIGAHAVGGEWCNVSCVELVNEDKGFAGVTLIAANTFDPLQF
jgi:hypothetical protein